MTDGRKLVQRATVDDSDRFAAIHALAFPQHEAWGSDVFHLQLGLGNVIGLIQGDAGIILLRVAEPEAEILTLAVVPAARRQGVGSAVLEQGLIHVATAGASVVFLEVSVKNTAALTLYTRSRFKPVGRRPRYYSDGSDALVLRVDLPQPKQGLRLGDLTSRGGSTAG